MKRKILVLVVSLWVGVLIAHGAVVDRAPYATGSLVWDYVLGSSPDNNAIPEMFVIRCGKPGGPRNIERWVEVPLAEQKGPVVKGKIRLNSLLPERMAAECVQAPWNPEVGEGLASAPYPFVAMGGGFAGPPTNTRLEK